MTHSPSSAQSEDVTRELALADHGLETLPERTAFRNGWNARAAASAQASAFDGDSEVTRKAFREYDAEYPVSHRSHWQIWRDAIAYAVKSGIATPPSPSAATSHMTPNIIAPTHRPHDTLVRPSATCSPLPKETNND